LDCDRQDKRVKEAAREDSERKKEEGRRKREEGKRD